MTTRDELAAFYLATVDEIDEPLTFISEYQNNIHSGDCTKQAWSCLRCEVEYAFEKADKFLVNDYSHAAPNIERPDWERVYRDCGGVKPRSQELLATTRETLRLARSALRELNRADAYHNYMAAEREIGLVLNESLPPEPPSEGE